MTDIKDVQTLAQLLAINDGHFGNQVWVWDESATYTACPAGSENALAGRNCGWVRGDESKPYDGAVPATKVWRQKSDGSAPVGTYGPTTFDALVGAVSGASSGVANSDAIEAIFASGITDVLFPPGVFYFARPIVPPSGALIRGSGESVTGLTAAAAIGTGALLDVHNSKVHLRDFWCDGEFATGCTLIWFGNPAHDPAIAAFCKTENVTCKWAGTGYGIREDNAVMNKFENMYVYGCAENLTVGKAPSQPGCPTTGHYTHCTFDSGTYGTRYYTGSSYVFDGRSLWENCTTRGFDAPIAANCGGLTLEDCWFEGNVSHLDIDGTNGLANLTLKRCYYNVSAGQTAAHLKHVNRFRVEGGAAGSGDGILLIDGGASDGAVDASFNGIVKNDATTRSDIVVNTSSASYPFRGSYILYATPDYVRTESGALVAPSLEGAGKLATIGGTSTAINTSSYGCGDAVVSVPSAEYLLDTLANYAALHGTRTPFICAFKLQVDSVAGTKDWFSVSNAAFDRVAVGAFTDGANLQMIRFDGATATYVTAALPSANTMLTYVYCLHNDGKAYLVSAAGTSAGTVDGTGNITGLTGCYLGARGTANHAPPNILWRHFSVRTPTVAANCLSEAQRLYTRLAGIP